MENEFGNSRIISILGLSTFVLGIAFGPMVFGPMSEFYGRRPIYLVAWTTFFLFIFPEAFGRNIQTIIVCRFFGGFAGSTFLAVSGGTVGDLFQKHELQAPMAMFALAPFLGPTTGPVAGGFISYHVDWRWTYYAFLIWSFFLLLAIVFLVPETYRKYPCLCIDALTTWITNSLVTSRPDSAAQQGQRLAKAHWRR